MNRTGRALTLGCLLLLQPLLALAEGGNSLLIPATGRCTLNVQPEDLANALKACEQTANAGDAQAQFELGEYYYTQTPKTSTKPWTGSRRLRCKVRPTPSIVWVPCSSMAKGSRPTTCRPTSC